MSQLINKGGFRERANRNRNYRQSENELTTLIPNQYRPASPAPKSTDQSIQPEQKQDIPSSNETY